MLARHVQPGQEFSLPRRGLPTEPGAAKPPRPAHSEDTPLLQEHGGIPGLCLVSLPAEAALICWCYCTATSLP